MSNLLSYRVAHAYYQALACPRSLTCDILLRYGEYEQLVNLDFDPFHYNSVTSARDALAATSYLSKFPAFPIEIDRELVALNKFFDAEKACRDRNDHFFSEQSALPEIHLAKEYIRNVLGRFNPEYFVGSCNWGPGSTLSIQGRDATSTRKFYEDLELSPACFQFVKPWFDEAYPLWAPLSRGAFKIVQGNKIITVPKNAKTDRVIAVEPSGNLWLQKGVGAMIRSKLLNCGIDLNKQCQNQRLARLGSRYNDLATIDFSSASDTISLSCVVELIPESWLRVMERLRSPFGMSKGSLIEYEKFSSMGNGFTFELESLIFWAIGKAVCAEDPDAIVSIYGDDLIIPSKFAERARVVFAACGFSFNPKKSYATSYYRESCGKHYWNGVDISPIYLKEQITNEISLIRAHNNLRRFSHRLLSYGCEKRFKSVCSYLRLICRKTYRRVVRVPLDFGDTGFISNFDEACPPLCRSGHEGYRLRLIVNKPYERWCDDPALLLSRLWCTIGSDRSYKNCDFLPRRTRLKLSKSSCRVWYDLGPWL